MPGPTQHSSWSPEDPGGSTYMNRSMATCQRISDHLVIWSSESDDLGMIRPSIQVRRGTLDHVGGLPALRYGPRKRYHNLYTTGRPRCIQQTMSPLNDVISSDTRKNKTVWRFEPGPVRRDLSSGSAIRQSVEVTRTPDGDSLRRKRTSVMMYTRCCTGTRHNPIRCDRKGRKGRGGLS